jgi:chromate transporter
VAALIGVIAIFLPGAILLAVALSFGSVLEKWKDRFIYVNAVVVGLLFAVLINPVFTEAVYSGPTTALAILSLLVCIALKRSPLELVIVMTGAAYICHLLEWI